MAVKVYVCSHKLSDTWRHKCTVSRVRSVVTKCEARVYSQAGR
jgi:hypothetical protein